MLFKLLITLLAIFLLIFAVAVVLYAVASSFGFAELALQLVISQVFGVVEPGQINSGQNGPSVWAVLAFIASIGSITYGIAVKWHYIESELSMRFAEWIQRGWNTQVINRRNALLPRLSPELGLIVAVPTAPKSRFPITRGPNRVTRTRRVDLKELELEINDLCGRLRNCQFLKTTTHLVNGLNHAEKGDAGELALAEFKKALSVQRDDLDALELAAKQHFQLNDWPAASSTFEHLVQEARVQGKALVLARAQRYRCTVMKLEGTAPRLKEAAGLLDTVRRDLSARTDQFAVDKARELAYLNEVLGDVQFTREKYKVAGDAYEQAIVYFDRLSEPERSAGKKRVKARIDELIKAKFDAKNSPDESNGDDPVTD